MIDRDDSIVGCERVENLKPIERATRKPTVQQYDGWRTDWSVDFAHKGSAASRQLHEAAARKVRVQRSLSERGGVCHRCPDRPSIGVA